MTRIEREKQTVRKMIELYCRHRLKKDKMPEEYQHLAEFACVEGYNRLKNWIKRKKG